ncbi:TIGR04255 family protein [Candidatus Poriferisodalis sp.]|uniref:TIGR04255 family protein n=1 Tax=Candidatus Poriferisodalis sp. TaxID=3101277 RepID=UPI003B0286F3
MGYSREVYANAPLVFVACEIRFPLVPSLTTDDTLDCLVEDFFDLLPIPATTIVEWGDEDSDDGDHAQRVLRFSNRDRTSSAVLTRTSLSIETTTYREWPDFRSQVMSAVDVVAGNAKVAGVERLGLRYIDEIRVPEPIVDATMWRKWIAEDVLSHLSVVPDMAPAGFTSATVLHNGSHHMLVRYAAMNGPGVVADKPLRRSTVPPEGPFFVIDVDSYRDTSGVDMIDFSAESIASVLDDLHEPIGMLFQRSITDRARELFRKEPE